MGRVVAPIFGHVVVAEYPPSPEVCRTRRSHPRIHPGRVKWPSSGHPQVLLGHLATPLPFGSISHRLAQGNRSGRRGHFGALRTPGVVAGGSFGPPGHSAGNWGVCVLHSSGLDGYQHSGYPLSPLFWACRILLPYGCGSDNHTQRRRRASSLLVPSSCWPNRSQCSGPPWLWNGG